MKVFLYTTATLIALTTFAAAQDEYVQGYYRNDGTYVQPHHRSAPDNSTDNNYSTEGNMNPYTGAAGTQNPSPSENNFEPRQYAAPPLDNPPTSRGSSYQHAPSGM